MNRSLSLAIAIVLLVASNLSAATHYVSLGSTNPTPPYTNWVTAATSIQAALNVAATNDVVLVTNGVYPGHVSVTNELALLSVNGPQFTVINGGGTNRCVSLTNGASLTGFTLTNDYNPNGYVGGVESASTNAFLTNCLIVGNSGVGASGGTLYNCTLSGNWGGGAAGCTLYNCTLSGNRGGQGGGASASTLYNCTLTGNSAQNGGGAFLSTLYNCALTYNFAEYEGGGVHSSTLCNCTLTDNSAFVPNFANFSGGGGAWGGTLSNCTLSGNSSYFGGGTFGSTLLNCTLRGNSVQGYEVLGGGANGGTLYNCTLDGNRATGEITSGGGTSGSTLYNCSLTGNSAQEGGGSYAGTLYNCTLSGNSADNGGGACAGTLNNCTLSDNSASYGGGAYGSTLNNCTLSGNTATETGGGAAGRLYNCIIYYNTASSGGANYTPYSTLNYCCAMPQPTNGVGNITNAPLFVDYATGNLRLQSNSLCINAGKNTYVMTATDLAGKPRVVSGTVDIGAYEYQGPGSRISYAWLQQYRLPTDGSADYADPDHDGMNNWQEWVCGTNPTNALSALRIVSVLPTSTSATVAWQSVVGVNYFLERSPNLAAPFTLLATNIVGLSGITSYSGADFPPGAGPFFYRVGVGN